MHRAWAATALLALSTLAFTGGEEDSVSRRLPDAGLGSSWPGWRGPASDGATAADGVFSRPFRLEVRWRRVLGSGYSAVSVAEGHAVTMFSDGERDFLISLSADRGDEEWRVPLGPTWPGREGANDGPISTPALHSGRAYALAPRGDLLAVGLDDGRVRWRRRLAEELGAATPHWGFGGSPIVVDGLVVVATGGPDSSLVTAFDAESGQTVWTSSTEESSYPSPIVTLSAAGDRRLVAAGDDVLLVLDPRSGRELGRWKHGGSGFYRRIINPLVLAPDLLLLTHRPDEASAVSIGAAEPELRWTTPHLKRNYATPVLHGSHVYGFSGNFLTCIDARSGELRWKSRPPGNGFPIVVDGHLVVQTKQGVLAVAEASPAGWREQARLKLFENLTWTPPSFAGGRIYARDSYSELAAVDVVPLDEIRRAPDVEAALSPGTVPESRFARWVAETRVRPDAQERALRLLERQQSFPIVEAGRWVHFVYRGRVDDLAINGSLFEYGDQQPMHRVEGTDLHYASFEVEADARLVYQFVPDFERRVDSRNPRSAPSMHFQGEVSILEMPESRPTEIPAASRRGRLVDVPFETERIPIGSKTWGGPRTLRVYLPADYAERPGRRYPSAYVLYGSRMLDDGQLDQRLDAALGESVEPLIAVFVESISPYEYARTQREAHGRMLAETVVPLVDSRFRTLGSPEHRAVVGAHEGGYAAVEIGLRFPEVFGKVGALSVRPVGKGGQELLGLLDRRPLQPLRLYVDWGRYDPVRRRDRIDVPGFSRLLRERLLEKGYPVAGREWNDGSDLLFWSQRSIHALEALVPVSGAGAQ